MPAEAIPICCRAAGKINLLRTLLRRLNAEVHAYWNSDRSDAQVKRISVVQQECKRHVG